MHYFIKEDTKTVYLYKRDMNMVYIDFYIGDKQQLKGTFCIAHMRTVVNIILFVTDKRQLNVLKILST